jgi:hypothetical protein
MTDYTTERYAPKFIPDRCRVHNYDEAKVDMANVECHRSAWSKWSQVLHATYRTADDTRFHVRILAGTKQPQK